MTKILHVASFSGNVGDNANHNGLRNSLKKLTGKKLTYTELEIRRFYQNYTYEDKLRFDASFAKLANEHDLVIIGGGNFFEVWIDSSSTGTTIDMPLNIVDKIETPIFFFGLGFDPYKGAPKENVEKFKRFIDHILKKEIHTVTVRNDGSAKHIAKYLGKEYLNKVHTIPDGGFFLQIDKKAENPLRIKSNYFALNIAKDMAALRFKEDMNGISYETFIYKLAHILDSFLHSHEDLELVLVPHIFSDLDAVFDLLEEMEERHRRNRITVAPLLHGEGAEEIIFSIYDDAVFSMGMRFHTNVCSIGLGTPTIGLVSYPKLHDLYEELDMLDRTVNVNISGFEKELAAMMENTLLNTTDIKKRYKKVKSELEVSMQDRLSTLFGEDSVIL